MGIKIEPFTKTSGAFRRKMFKEVITPDIISGQKGDRINNVRSIVVTTSNGNTFDGDETSQNRINRAITVMNNKPKGYTFNWKLAILW